MSKIQKITARQILDSRGNPTVEVDLVTDTGFKGRASVPSGASTGSREALELRDGDKSYYLGKSVRKAIANINDKIAPIVIGHDVSDIRGIDSKMIELDGTDFKTNLGAKEFIQGFRNYNSNIFVDKDIKQRLPLKLSECSN